MADLIKKEESKTDLAKKLGVSRSSLYYQPILPKKDLILKKEILAVMRDNKAYGHRRIALALSINKKRILRVMKIFNLKPQRTRRKPKKEKDINQKPMPITNMIEDLIIEKPNQVWVSDFTYLPYFGKFIYLATVMDLFTRKILGWETSTRHTADLVKKALINSIANNNFILPDIIHSDQGSEYRSKDYLNFLEMMKILPSMSKKASPWENGYKESFYSEFKLELGHPEIYEDMGELIEAIARQIYYYNHHRIHTALKCSPVIFEQRLKVEKSKILNQEKKNILFV